MRVGAHRGDWSVRMPERTLGTASDCWSRMTQAMPSVWAWMSRVVRSYQASIGPRASSTKRWPSSLTRTP